MERDETRTKRARGDAPLDGAPRAPPGVALGSALPRLGAPRPAAALQAAPTACAHCGVHPNVRVHDAGAPGAPGVRALGELVAVSGAVRALDEMIKKRRILRASYASMRMPTMIVLCGHAGSGRSTLARSYAAHTGLTVVELSERVGALTPADVNAAYETARSRLPALVLLRGCDDVLLSRVPSDAPTLLQRVLATALSDTRSEIAVWSVIALDAPYTALPPILSDHCFYAAWLAPPSYVNSAQVQPADGYAARRALVLLMMRERAPLVEAMEEQRIYVECAERIIAASRNTTPRQLGAFLDRLFSAPYARLKFGELSVSSAVSMLPTPVHVRECMYTDESRAESVLATPADAAVVRPYERLSVHAAGRG